MAFRMRMNQGLYELFGTCSMPNKAGLARLCAVFRFMSTQARSQVTSYSKSKLFLISLVITVLASILLPRISLSPRVCWPSTVTSFRFASSAFHPTPSTRAFNKMAYEKEQQVAIAAVLKACDVAQATFQKLVNDETVTKKDKSPVTGKSSSP